MGFTPGEGLIMGTRCGDLDPGVVAFLERDGGPRPARRSTNCSTSRAACSGSRAFPATCAKSSRRPKPGTHRALVALKAFCYRVRKYIGAYLAAMGGLDVLIFTGGIGQGSAGVRSLALQGLQCMGIHLDEQRNREARGFDEICRISTDDSPRHRPRRADGRGADDRPRDAARAEPLVPHTRPRSAPERTDSHRGVRAPHPPGAGARRGAVRPGASADQAKRPLAARPVCLPGAAHHRRARRAASSACACSGRRARRPRWRSR